MTVSKLIELLKRQPPDMEVLYSNYEDKGFEDGDGNLVVYTLMGVEAVEIDDKTPACLIYTCDEHSVFDKDLNK